MRAPLFARGILAALAALLAGVFALPALQAQGGDPRGPEGCVLTGAAAPALLGADPGRLAAFRWEGDAWAQVPLQVDERAVIDLARPYNEAPTGHVFLAYTDPQTWVGADGDPLLDADDELAWMRRDMGAAAPAETPYPAGTLAGSGLQVTATDPLGHAATGFLYLFRTDGSLAPGAGQAYVGYTFALASGQPYRTGYSLSGANAETSSFTSPYWRAGWSDMWLWDRFAWADGVDRLDRIRTQPSATDCKRTEKTFSDGPGGFICNRSGPVRAIRAYMGANSGKYTTREHVMWERRHDLIDVSRVHAVRGGISALDWAAALTGWSYHNQRNLPGVPVDGAADPLAAGPLDWELWSGPAGALTLAHLIDTDIALTGRTSYYLDRSSVKQCAPGDGAAYGMAGFSIEQDLPNTDPRQSPVCRLVSRRVMTVEPAGTGTAEAAARDAEARTPLALAAAPF